MSRSLMRSPLLISLAGLAALAVAMGIGRFAFTPILPMMLAEHSLSLRSGGMLASVNYIGYFIGAIGAAFISFKPERTIPFGMLAISLLTLAMGLDLPLAAWFVLRGMAGIASAWVLVSVSSWSLNQLAPYNKPLLNGVVFAGVGVGIAITGLFCLLLTALDGSASITWTIVGLLALILTALTWGSFSELPGYFAGSTDLPTPYRWNSASIRIILAYGLFGFGYIIPATFLPVMARHALPDPALSAWSWPLFGIVGAISVLFTGPLARRIGNRRLWVACHVILAAGVALPALFDGLLPVMLAALCVGGTFMVITLAAMQEAKAVSTDNPAPLIAAMTSAFALGQIIGPLAVPLLSHSTPGSTPDFTLTLLVSAGLMTGSAAILIKDPGRKSGLSKTERNTQGIQS